MDRFKAIMRALGLSMVISTAVGAFLGTFVALLGDPGTDSRWLFFIYMVVSALFLMTVPVFFLLYHFSPKIRDSIKNPPSELKRRREI